MTGFATLVRADIDRARRYLDTGRLADAIVAYGLARHTMGNALGSMGAKVFERDADLAALARVLTWLGADLGLSAQPERVAPEALRAELVVALSVLRQQGVELTDERIEERAANIAAGICGAYDVRVPRRRA